jgi:hypothetical protein
MSEHRADAVAVTYCERHPDVETVLTCGRCGDSICPRCMVHTPGGIRCPDCARLRRPVMYELSAKHYALALAAALGVGLPLGVLGAILIPVFRFGFFGLFIGLLAGMGAGTLMAEAMARATRYKRGMAMQAMAAGGILLAGAIYVFASGLPPQLAIRDLVAWAAIAGAVMTAWGRLR